MSPRSRQEVSKCNQDRPQRPQDKHKIQRSRLQSVCNQAGCRDVQKRIQKIAQDASQKPQDEPKIVTKVPKGHRNRLECWLDPDDDGYDAIRMIFRRTNCLGSTRRYHFFCPPCSGQSSSLRSLAPQQSRGVL